MATISVHNGTTIALEHNVRDEEYVKNEPHIDPGGIHETWEEMAPTVRQAYDMLFGQSQANYNARQTRDDRKIDSYYDDFMQKSKKDAERREKILAENDIIYAKYRADCDAWKEAKARGEVAEKPKLNLNPLPAVQKPMYEMIVGIYPAEGEHLTERQQHDMLQEWFKGFKERNPHLAVFGCYYHADEPGAQPHLHLDYIPVATGYKRGMEARNGLDRALQQEGYTSTGIGRETHTAQQQMLSTERDALEAICNANGITVEHPQAGKAVRHEDTPTYKRKNLARKEAALKEREQALVRKEMALAHKESEMIHREAKISERESRFEARIGNFDTWWNKVTESAEKPRIEANKAIEKANKVVDQLYKLAENMSEPYVKAGKKVPTGVANLIAIADNTHKTIDNAYKHNNEPVQKPKGFYDWEAEQERRNKKLMGIRLDSSPDSPDHDFQV